SSATSTPPTLWSPWSPASSSSGFPSGGVGPMTALQEKRNRVQLFFGKRPRQPAEADRDVVQTARGVAGPVMTQPGHHYLDHGQADVRPGLVEYQHLQRGHRSGRRNP